MKYFYKSISALFVFFMVSGVIAGERNAWKVEPISHSTGYTVPGSMMSQHQFGMLKHSNICASDELYLIWSSDRADIWSLSGQRVNVLANFDGTSLEMPLEVVSIKELGGNKHLVMFSHVYANDAVIDLIGKSQRLTVSMPQEDPAMSALFGVNQDSFNIAGFMDARAAAAQRCNGLSDQITTAANF